MIENEHPKLYQLLCELSEERACFQEAIWLLEREFQIVIANYYGYWEVSIRAVLEKQDFPTFAQAFAYALSLLKLRKVK